MDKKKAIWAVLFFVIAGLSIWTVMSQNKTFSLVEFGQFFKTAKKSWMLGGAVCMFGFIWFEGLAITRIIKGLGHKKRTHGTVYGAADVYFSAITPSASGGQPASAYFMMKDGIPGTAATATLLINLVMYTLALLTVGFLCMIVRRDMFWGFSHVSRVMIAVGFIVLVAMGIGFYMLLLKPAILHKIGYGAIGVLSKIHIIKHREKKEKKLDKTIVEYGKCAEVIAGHKRMLLEVYVCNLLQRVSQLSVAFMVMMAMGFSVKEATDAWFVQCFMHIGSSCVPIPGAMGAADYLMLDGFKQSMTEQVATNMELLCRGLTFYLCIAVSAAIALGGYMIRKMKKRESK